MLSFVFAGQAGRARGIVICINPAPSQMIGGTEKPIRSLQTRSAIQQIWLVYKEFIRELTVSDRLSAATLPKIM